MIKLTKILHPKLLNNYHFKLSTLNNTSKLNTDQSYNRTPSTASQQSQNKNNHLQQILKNHPNYPKTHHPNYLETQQTNKINKKVTIELSQNSPLIRIVKKRKTAKQRILESKFFREWLICYIISCFLVFGGHMYFPETFLSTNWFFTKSYSITKKAEKQVLSGKHGSPKLANNNN